MCLLGLELEREQLFTIHELGNRTFVVLKEISDPNMFKIRSTQTKLLINSDIYYLETS